MNTSWWRLLVVSVVCAVLSGCASENERAYLSEFERLSTESGSPVGEHRANGEARSSATTRPAQLGENPAIEDYIAYAAMHNPGLEAAFARWAEALERIPQARALEDPVLSYQYWIVRPMMRDGEQRDAFQLRQAIPWLERLVARGDIAAKEAQAAYQRFEAQRLALVRQVKQAYWEYYYLARVIDITQDNLRQMRAIQAIAEARYGTNAAPQADVVRAQLEVARVDDDVRSLKDMRPSVAGKLSAALGRKNDELLPWPAPMGAEDLPEVRDEQIAQTLEDFNPDLKALEAEAQGQRRGIDLANLSYLPDFMIGAEFDTVVKSSAVPDETPKDQVAVMISANIPIWFEKYAAGVREARAKYWAARADKAQKYNDLLSDAKVAAYNCRNSQRKMHLYGNVLTAQARQSLASLQAAYQTGSAAFSDILDAQRLLLEFQLAYERAAADRRQRLAELEMIVGRTLASQTPAPTSQPAADGVPSSAPATRPSTAEAHPATLE